MQDNKNSNRPKNYVEFEDILEFKKDNKKFTNSLEKKEVVIEIKEEKVSPINEEISVLKQTNEILEEKIEAKQEENKSEEKIVNNVNVSSPSKSSYVWTINSGDNKSNNNYKPTYNFNETEDIETATSSINEIQSRKTEQNINDNKYIDESNTLFTTSADISGVVESDDFEITDEMLEEAFLELGIKEDLDDELSEDVSLDNLFIDINDFSVEEEDSEINNNRFVFGDDIDYEVDCKDCEDCKCNDEDDESCNCEECECSESNDLLCDCDESYDDLIEAIIDCDDSSDEYESNNEQVQNKDYYDDSKENFVEVKDDNEGFIIVDDHLSDDSMYHGDTIENDVDDIQIIEETIIDEEIKEDSVKDSFKKEDINVNDELKKELNNKNDEFLKRNESLEKIREKISHLELSIKEFDKTSIYSQKDLIKKLVETENASLEEKEKLIKSANQKIEYIQEVIQRAKNYDCSFLESMIAKIEEALTIFKENND